MKELGRMGLSIISEGLGSYALGLFTRYLGMSPEEAEESCDNVLDELLTRGVHTYNTQ